MQNQIYVFIVFILNGVLIGLLFDCFRALRKSFKTPDMITYIEDIIFGILSGILILSSIMRFNDGEIRVYLFLGIILGLTLYLLIFSRIFIKVSVSLITFFIKIINLIILIPVKFIYRLFRKILFKPIIFVCLNIRQLFKKIKIPKIKHKKIKEQIIEEKS